jgi:ATP-dependent DNA helicase RecG
MDDISSDKLGVMNGAASQNKLVPTKGKILLFGRQRTQHFSDAWIQCGRFLGTEKIDIFDHIDIDIPLSQAVDEVMLFLKKHAYRGVDLTEVRRKDVWSIPLGILREVIINALVHSDYSQRGAPIRVVFLDDRTVTVRRVSHQIATLIPLFQTAGEAI